MQVQPDIVNQRLTLWQKLDLVPAMVHIVAVAILSIFTGLWRDPKGAPTLYLHVAYAVLRKAVSRLSPLQFQLIQSTTDETYEQYCRLAAVPPQTVALKHGARAHWMGNEKAEHVLVWYHGGGFCLPANMGYFRFWDQLIKSSSAGGKSLAIFSLSYTLAPHAQYPTQLTQAVEALRYILTKTGRRPRQVLLGGDSAGGNLVFGVLSHLTHPHEAIAELELREPLAGAVCIAPWVFLKESHGDEKTDCRGDLVTPDVVKPWSRAYLGSAKADYYTDAADAPPSWFNKFPIQKILVLAGQNEIAMPLIQAFVQKLRVGFPAVELFVGEREAHVAPVYNIFVGDTAETKQGRRLKEWLKDLL